MRFLIFLVLLLSINLVVGEGFFDEYLKAGCLAPFKVQYVAKLQRTCMDCFDLFREIPLAVLCRCVLKFYKI